MSAELKNERTLVLVKTDAVMRGLIGEIIGRFERAGLKIVAMKMVYPGKEHAAGHYSGSEEWLKGMGNKTLDSFSQNNLDVKAIMGTDDPLEIGKMVQQWNVDYLSSGPVVALVLEGIHAIAAVRRIIGFTIPARAEVGTIRGGLSIDSNTIANIEKRATKNLVHASGDKTEAEHEIQHWFESEKILNYKRCDAHVMF